MTHARRLVYVVKWTHVDGEPDLMFFDRRSEAEAAMARIKNPKLSLHMTGEPKPFKLSEPMKDYLKGFAAEGYRCSPLGGKGRTGAMAWHRTTDALVDLGLVKRREGSRSTTYLTWLGLAWVVHLLKENA